MGSINIGSQSIHWYYQEAATAANFNQVLRDIIKPGIYTGGLITLIPLHTAQIAPFKCYINSNDVSQTAGIHLQTQSTVTLNIPSTPNADFTIYITYSYLPNLTNYADFNIRLTASPPVTNEIKVGRVLNDGAGALSSVIYQNSTYPPATGYGTQYRTRGSFDVDNGGQLISDIAPTQIYHVGNQAYNDARYVKRNGAGPYDVQILDSTAGTNPSTLTSTLTGARTWTLQDRSMTLADNRAAFRLGMITSTLEIITPSDLTPWLDINQDIVLTPTNWPILCPFLRALIGTVSGSTTFTTTSISTSGSPVTITLTNNATNNAFLLALNEEQLYYGSFSAFRTITTNAPIGTFPAGTYAIQGISTGSRTITLTASYSGVSSSGTISYYPFRLPDTTSTVNAKWFQVNDAVLQTTGGDTIPYFRVRDRFQGHRHASGYDGLGLLFNGGGTNNSPGGTGGDIGSGFTILNPITDTVNGTPRTGLTTRSKGMAIYKYLYGGTYLP